MSIFWSGICILFWKMKFLYKTGIFLGQVRYCEVFRDVECLSSFLQGLSPFGRGGVTACWPHTVKYVVTCRLLLMAPLMTVLGNKKRCWGLTYNHQMILSVYAGQEGVHELPQIGLTLSQLFLLVFCYKVKNVPLLWSVVVELKIIIFLVIHHNNINIYL